MVDHQAPTRGSGPGALFEVQAPVTDRSVSTAANVTVRCNLLGGRHDVKSNTHLLQLVTELGRKLTTQLSWSRGAVGIWDHQSVVIESRNNVAVKVI